MEDQQQWKLVPVEPTLEMGWAYLDAARADDPLGAESMRFSWPGYRAMLAASPSSSVLERARDALRNLIRGYVNTLENGRDRIISLSGQCDSVEAMERSDPNLRAARSALAEIDRALGGGNGGADLPDGAQR